MYLADLLLSTPVVSLTSTVGNSIEHLGCDLTPAPFMKMLSEEVIPAIEFLTVQMIDRTKVF